jgi:hypothetical protein
MTELKTFKTISVAGTPKGPLVGRLIEAGVQFNEYAKILFEHPAFSISDKAEQVRLVKLKSSELGISIPSSFLEIIKKSAEFGLELCPLYVAAFLRLEYLEQPEGPYLTVASARIEQDQNYPTGFYLRNYENSLWLRGYQATDEYKWPIDSEFIFLGGL